MADNRASTPLTISEQVTYFFYAYLRISALLKIAACICVLPAHHAESPLPP